mmetsp:Transcript_13367/g.44278  ORF Transcript_13367/g.44278 Transcript_13367/m.44278 type:complete len:183 (+) Transcript_13367:825-1373(+)
MACAKVWKRDPWCGTNLLSDHAERPMPDSARPCFTPRGDGERKEALVATAGGAKFTASLGPSSETSTAKPPDAARKCVSFDGDTATRYTRNRVGDEERAETQTCVTPTESTATGEDHDQTPWQAGRNTRSRSESRLPTRVGCEPHAVFSAFDQRVTATSPPGGTVFVDSHPGWRTNKASAKF